MYTWHNAGAAKVRPGTWQSEFKGRSVLPRVGACRARAAASRRVGDTPAHRYVGAAPLATGAPSRPTGQMAVASKEKAAKPEVDHKEQEYH